MTRAILGPVRSSGAGRGDGLWTGRRVLVTGHTGFKGSWLSEMLLARGARVFGLALAPEGPRNLFADLGGALRLDHAEGDIRDCARVAERVRQVAPEVVFHLAAQPLVRRSYRDPVGTWATNVMGTLHLLEALGALAAVAPRPVTVVVATTDKVYATPDPQVGCLETDRLGGHDPYAASKAAVEIAVESWRKSFAAGGLRLATVRAGNVIGGGDWSEDRLFPDLMRARESGGAFAPRNPGAVRPWQHVIDPLRGYLTLAERLLVSGDPRWQGAFNFGPAPGDQRSVRDLVAAVDRLWQAPPAPEGSAAPLPGRQPLPSEALHEADRLLLCSDKARGALGWEPHWDFATSVAQSLSWYRAVAAGADARALTRAQIAANADCTAVRA